MSIFATSITDSSIDHSNARLRVKVRSDAHAERILAACVAAIVAVSGESSGIVEDDIRYQAQGSQATARAAIKLVSSALQSVASAYTITSAQIGAGEGFESAAPIHDCRNGQAVAERILVSA